MWSTVFGSCAVTAPPPPVVMILFWQKLNMFESPKVATFFPSIDAPNASAASSITIKSLSSAISLISLILQGHPP